MLLELFGKKIDPGADYLIYFSGEQKPLSSAVLKRYKDIMNLVYRSPSFAVASRLLGSIPLDEIPHTIMLSGLLTIEFVMDRNLIPLFDQDFGSGNERDRKITVLTAEGHAKIKEYRNRMRDKSGGGVKYF